MRLIDADALKKEFPKDTDWEYPTNTNEYVCEKIDAQPTVQPEINCSEIPNNSDTIYRQQAIDFVGSMNMCDEISNEAYKKLTSYLDELPPAQPDIIRCPNCRYNDGTAYCEVHYRDVGAKDYCSWAERREDE